MVNCTERNSAIFSAKDATRRKLVVRFLICALVVAAAGWCGRFAQAQQATYSVTFQGNWTLDSTPGGVAGGAHFTTLIGAVHSSDVTFWASGAMATAGVEDVAELGSTGAFRAEVQASPHTGAVIEQGVSGGGTGSATFTISPSTTYPRVTLLSMIGPSPDWFVGVSGLSLLDDNGQWYATREVNLYPYDAGTEEGEDFSLSNPATNPQGVITSLQGEGKFSNERMARLTFTLMASDPVVSFAQAASTVGEGGSSADVTINLSPTPVSAITVGYTVGGTAGSSDFSIGSSGSLSVTNGASTATIQVTISEDTDYEGDETVVLTLASGSGYSVGGTAVHTLTITENDPEPVSTVSLSASPNPVEEGESVTITVSLSVSQNTDVTIPLEITSDTAEDGDYSTLSGITITAGNTSGTGDISAEQDADVDDETFTVALGSSLPPGIEARSPTSVEITITDDDLSAVSISASPNPVEEGESVTITATLSESQSTNVTIPLEITPDTAEDGDYSTLSGIAITAGNTSGTGDISAEQDADMDDETFTVALGSSLPPGTEAGSPTSVEITITDDDLSSVSLSASPNPVEEGGSVTITATLSESQSTNVTIPLEITPDTAEDGDYSTLSGIAITAGNTSGTGDISAEQDADMDDETFTVALGSSLPPGIEAGSPAAVEITITDDDPQLRSFAFTPTMLVIGEGQSDTLTIHLELTEASDLDVTVAGHEGTDVRVDGSQEPVTLQVSSGSLSDSIAVSAVMDADWMDDEVVLQFDAPGYVTAHVNVRVLDSDIASVQVTQPMIRLWEGSTAEVGMMLSLPPVGAVQVTVTGHEATDLILSETVFTFAAEDWDTEQVLRVEAGQDDDGIADEVVTLFLDAQGGGYDHIAQADVRITDDEGIVVSGGGKLHLWEGQSGSFTVHLQTAPRANMVLSVAGHGVTAAPQLLIFTASTHGMAQEVMVESVADRNETNDRAEVLLTATGGIYESVSGGVEVIVLDKDAHTLEVAGDHTLTLDEEGVAQTVGVRLSDAPEGDVMVAVTGHANTDLDVEPLMLTFTESNWNEEQQIAVSARDDADDVDDEALLTLTPHGGEYTGKSVEIRVTVVDDDAIRTYKPETSEMPAAFVLHGPYPNPFNPSTRIVFDLPEAAQVGVVVTNLAGQHVLELPAQSLEAGFGHSMEVNATGLASGMYVCRVVARMDREVAVKTRLLVLVK